MIAMTFKNRLGCCGLLLFLAASLAQADVKLSGLFTEHMVLQQGLPIRIWGWAEPGEEIRITLADHSATATTSTDGKWNVTLPARAADGPFVLNVAGKNSVAVKDVMVGEVWIASGQSNMEWPLRKTDGSAAAIAGSANAKIRLFTVPKLRADAPVADVKASWKECTPETVPDFSGVAYYFARDLQKARHVTVGIIHTSWGGSPAEVWMSEASLTTNPTFQRDILDAYPATLKRHQEQIAEWEKEEAAAKKEGQPFQKNRPGAPWKPTELYNGMIAPLIPYAIQGAIWYQGESNADRAFQYRSLFSLLIKNWRKDWKLGEFTFLAVQLAPFMKIESQPGESAWAELRETQNHATKVLTKVGIAVITDVGEERDIHPQKKEPVGARLALAARGIAYREPIEYSGPVFRSMRREEGKLLLNFNHVGDGLEARGGELKGFAIAGADRKFVWAKAEIQGAQVVLSSPEVKEPVAVRYGWANYPVVNLWNKNGLPASPFRSDTYPMITKPKQTDEAEKAKAADAHEKK